MLTSSLMRFSINWFKNVPAESAVRSSVTFNSGRSSSFSHAYRQAFACIIPSVLEKEIATHSSTLAWKIPWNEEPGRLQSMGLLSVGHD